MVTLQKRSDFLAASRSAWTRRKGVVVQARKRNADEAGDRIRVGYTCSKKVGNAVARNRAKRRLRAAARQVIPQTGLSGWDYVLIGKRDITAERDFADLCEDVRSAICTLHKPAGRA